MTKLLKPFLAIGNSIVKWLLRSRIHWLLSRNVVLLHLTGRRSGRTYLVPVNYRAAPGGISIMTFRRRKWWRNLQSADTVLVHLKGQQQLMNVEIVLTDLDSIAEELVERGWVRKSIAPAKAEETVLIRLRTLDSSSESHQ